MSEAPIHSAQAVVHYYVESSRSWQAAYNAYLPLTLYHNPANDAYRVICLTPENQPIVNSVVVQGVQWSASSETFHTFADTQRAVFGFNFSSRQDADNYQAAIKRALAPKQQPPPPATPPPPAMAPQRPISMAPSMRPPAPPGPPGAPAAPPNPPGGRPSAGPPQPPQSPQPPPPAGPPPPPAGGPGGPPPPPPPPPIETDDSGDSGGGRSALSAQLAGVKLKKTTTSESGNLPSSGASTLRSSGSSDSLNRPPPAKASGGMGMMDEMAARLAKRAVVSSPEPSKVDRSTPPPGPPPAKSISSPAGRVAKDSPSTSANLSGPPIPPLHRKTSNHELDFAGILLQGRERDAPATVGDLIMVVEEIRRLLRKE